MNGLQPIVAEFDDEDRLLHAVATTRENGFEIVDVYTPYAVHGLDKAMGLRASRLTWICFVCGAIGLALSLYFEYWTSAIDWPINVGGKPFDSLPAFIPIAFECGMLGGALGAVIGFLRESRLPRHHHPLFRVERFERASNDKFYVSVAADDPRFGDATELLLGDA